VPAAVGQTLIQRHCHLPVTDHQIAVGLAGGDQRVPCGPAPRRPADGGRDEMIVAARQGTAPLARTFTSRRTKTTWGWRFEACRAMGHAACDPVRAGALGAGFGAYARGARRRRSGAFAADLLLPAAALAARSVGRLDGLADERGFAALLADYGVGARTAAYQLWGRGWLSSAALRDELIDGFAAG
jgi:hypothetical protein